MPKVYRQGVPPHPLTARLCEILDDLRHGWKTETLRRAGLGRDTLYRWKAGDNSPTLERFVEVANVLGYDVELVQRRKR